MRFIESIGGKLFPIGPDLVEYAFVVAVFLASLNKFRPEFVELFPDLFTHSLTQLVGFTTAETSQQSGQQHHLFLIDGNAVGVFQVTFHHRKVVLYGFTAVLAGNKLRNIIHGTGPI